MHFSHLGDDQFLSELKGKHVLLKALVHELGFLGGEFPVVFLLLSLMLGDIVKAELRNVVSVECEECAMCIQ